MSVTYIKEGVDGKGLGLNLFLRRGKGVVSRNGENGSWW